MTLSSDTETGSAISSSSTPFASVTDSNFNFFGIQAPFFAPYPIIIFDITWTAVAGQLTALSINYDETIDDISLYGAVGLGDFDGFGLTGGTAERVLGAPCSMFPTCVIAGFWQEVGVQAIPEPGSAAPIGCPFRLWFVWTKARGNEKLPDVNARSLDTDLGHFGHQRATATAFGALAR
jgi:hypothetical protein